MTTGIGPARETYKGTGEERKVLAEIADCQARLANLERAGLLDAPAMLDDEARLARLRGQLAALAGQSELDRLAGRSSPNSA